MLTMLGADTKKVRNINRTIVLNLIREIGPISKAYISRHTQISFSTVNRVVEELLEEELIRPVENRLERGGGRPGEVFEFNGKSHFAIGIDIGYPNIRGMVADLSGTVISEITIPAEKGNGTENYQRLLLLLHQLQDGMDSQHSKISGVGLGVAGIVDSASGIVLRSQIMGWDQFPLGKRLAKDTGLTLFIDSDINLITIGEYGFGVGQGVANLVCITLGTRVLCGMIINGELYRGFHFNSGRLDNFLPGVDPLAENNSLDAIVSSLSILNSTREVLQIIDPQRADLITDAKQVYQAAQQGEQWALSILQNIAPTLAVSIANISALLDPEMVLLSGRMAEEAGVLIPMITGYLNERLARIPHIQTSSLGTRSTVLGAIMLVYRGILSNW